MIESRFDALKGEAMSPLVGRDLALSQLCAAWSRVAAHEGQAILVSGEAGIGKSRLTAALMAQIGDEPHSRIRYFCAPQFANSAFAPFLMQIERAAGIQREDDAPTNRAKLLSLMQANCVDLDESDLIANSLGCLTARRTRQLKICRRKSEDKSSSKP